MNSNCPKCKRSSFPLWMKVFAIWPFNVQCRNCRTKVRLKIPRWQNILVQIIGQIVFWVVLLTGISAGMWGAIVGGMIGAIIAILIALIPGLFAELEVMPKKNA